MGYGALVISAGTDVLVIGAGVSGLSSAVALLGAGLRVAIYTAQPPQRTTSAVAGALWGPHLVGDDARLAGWATATLARLRELTGTPEAGVREISGLAASVDPAALQPPEFARGAGTLSRSDPAALPAGYATGWRYSAPVVAMPAYLDYLLDTVLRNGGQVHLGMPLRSVTEAEGLSAAPVIVNCSGIGAGDLVPDPAMVAVRGQVVVVANPGLAEFFVGERELPDEVTYIIPHGSTAVLGGTQQPGRTAAEPDPSDAARILGRCADVEPRLADAHVITHRVGLRPVRPSVRLEVAAASGGRCVIHNYGHGGAGVTLSWGCAQEVAGEAVKLLG